MAGYDDVISGRDALHRLDTLTSGAREEFDAAAQAAEGHSRRRTDLVRLRSEAYRELARMRLDVIKAGADDTLSAAEKEAERLLADHEKFLATIGGEVSQAESVLKDAEAKRRAGETEVDAALNAYETLTATVEQEVQSDPAYLGLKQGYEEARSVAVRAEQKLELAKTDRSEKGKPYEADPLFSYLWQRKFRTPEYRKGGVSRMLDNWVAKLCRYDEAYLNFARLTELPDRIAEHLASMRLEEAELAFEHAVRTGDAGHGQIDCQDSGVRAPASMQDFRGGTGPRGFLDAGGERTADAECIDDLLRLGPD